MATEKEKRAALALLLGEDVAEATIKTADDNHRTAEDVMRLAYKEYQDKGGDGTFADWMLDLSISLKEAEREQDALKAKKRPPAVEDNEDEDDEELDMDDLPMTKKDFKELMDGYTAEWKSYASKKEASATAREASATAALKEADDLQTARIGKLEAGIAALSAQLETATKELNELKGEQPPAVRGGLRPTQDPSNIVEKEVQQDPINGSFAELVNFIGGPVGGQ